jgi:hypothetical protein
MSWRDASCGSAADWRLRTQGSWSAPTRDTCCPTAPEDLACADFRKDAISSGSARSDHSRPPIQSHWALMVFRSSRLWRNIAETFPAPARRSHHDSDTRESVRIQGRQHASPGTRPCVCCSVLREGRCSPSSRRMGCRKKSLNSVPSNAAASRGRCSTSLRRTAGAIGSASNREMDSSIAVFQKAAAVRGGPRRLHRQLALGAFDGTVEPTTTPI